MSCMILTSCGSKDAPFNFFDISTWKFSISTKTYDDYMAAAYRSVSVGDSEKALAMYRKAVDTAQAEYGPNDLRIATSASYLASYCVSLGLFGEAETNYKKALRVDEANLGPNDPETVRIRNSLADVLVKLFKIDEAKALLKKSTHLHRQNVRN